MLSVTSEIGRLRRVLVHEPGPEIDRMVPSMMEDLLFDDILFGEGAREEHALFRRVLQLLGIEVIESSDLLAETLALPEARLWAANLLLGSLPPAERERFAAAAPREAVDLLVAGWRPEGNGAATDDPSANGDAESLFRVPPLPNWCFQRDPQIVLGNGVVFAAMATPARHPEAILARAAFRYHPELSATPVLCDPLEPGPGDAVLAEPHRPRLEGGDLLVLSPRIVAVGLSERTNQTGVNRLVRALARREDGPRWLFLLDLPRRRAFMHLDTLMTPVDHDACLVHAPAVLGPGRDRLGIRVIDLAAPDPRPTPCGDLFPALAARGLSIEPIPCGGPDPIDREREQWTDGANALCLAPGVILLYDRNVRTVDELVRHGFRPVRGRDLVLGREEIPLDEQGRTVILLPSHEMSRARGGPHCLSHPLLRDIISDRS